MADLSSNAVGIIGAGAMGSGIAQVAATAGWTVQLMDVDEPTVRAAIEGIGKRLDRLVAKGRLASEQRDEAAARLHVAQTPASFGECRLLLEAVVEDLKTKASVLLANLGQLPGDAIIATNTSSLSVSRLGSAIAQPHRTVGMHFFNPAPVMQLVEVVAGRHTDPQVVEEIAGIAADWGKKVARAADVPGFIVNNVARPFYLEAFRILEDGYAQPDEIDAAMRELGGFRMGPLELTDLIGQDVNTATTRSVWEQLDKPPLLAPSGLQEGLVAKGHLGRKTGRGVYFYEDGTKTKPALAIESRTPPSDTALGEAVAVFAAGAGATGGDSTQRYVLARILAALIVQATLAHQRGVAATADIDTALRFGTNYPHGPFEWADRIGAEACRRLLVALDHTDDHRFAVPPEPAGTEPS